MKLPVYLKASVLLIGIAILIAMLYIGRSILVPVVFASILAIVLHPVVNLFVRMRFNRVIAIIITLFLTLFVIVAFGALLLSQANRLSDSLPFLADKFTGLLNQGIDWISAHFDINAGKMDEWLSKTRSDLINTGTSAIGDTLVSLGNLLVIIFLIPVYVFMLLFYHSILIEFIHRLFSADQQGKVGQLITRTKSLIQKYLIGMIIEAGLVAALNTAALLILGIEYAVLLGIIGALLNIIPYIGGLVAVAMPMTVAMITKDSAWYPVYVLIIYYAIQLVDNNYIVPRIVASKVKLNALFSLLAVFVGGAVWGIPGMFISIPLLAVVKLVCDNVEPLKPWGFLLGDTMPPLISIKAVFKKQAKETIL
ncbi:MAG: AI-2E family transporter [Bacteroidales bacterium]|jgi:predicted PurR-regulated permease PerM|nr:AI-2E family transporter [Bacteroidales bacterium]